MSIYDEKILKKTIEKVKSAAKSATNRSAKTRKDLAKKYQEISTKIEKEYGPIATKALESGVKAARKFPVNEKSSTITGAALGTGIGYAIGGSVGVVGFFGGIGVAWPVLLGITLAFAGNRIGVGVDKAVIERKKAEQDDRYDALRDKYFDQLDQNRNSPKKTEIKRIYDVEEHVKLLRKALQNAEYHVIILCGWITDYVVDDEFKKLLADCLKRGVNVCIGYGYQSYNEQVSNPAQKEAEEYLERLKEWCSKVDPKGMLLVRKYPNHSKVLIRDNKYAVMGSFNWLSNTGRSRNAEKSWVVEDTDFVEQEAQIIINEIANHMDKRSFLKKFYPFLKH